MREFSPGKSLHKIIKKGELTNTHLKAAAELFHQLHQIKNFSAFPSKNPILEFLSVNLKRSKRLNPVLYPILEDLRKRSMKVIKKSERKSITLCHGDLTPSNIIFDNKKAQLIDWDLAHKNEPVYDLAYFSAHLVDTMTIKEVSERKILAARNAFLKAYHASFSKKRFLAWETLTLVVATDHLLQSYCYDHMKKRIDFMLKMAEQSILLCEKIKS